MSAESETYIMHWIEQRNVQKTRMCFDGAPQSWLEIIYETLAGDTLDYESFPLKVCF